VIPLAVEDVSIVYTYVKKQTLHNDPLVMNLLRDLAPQIDTYHVRGRLFPRLLVVLVGASS
jgi:hypothetical protein